MLNKSFVVNYFHFNFFSKKIAKNRGGGGGGGGVGVGLDQNLS